MTHGSFSWGRFTKGIFDQIRQFGAIKIHNDIRTLMSPAYVQCTFGPKVDIVSLSLSYWFFFVTMETQMLILFKKKMMIFWNIFPISRWT